MSYTKIISSTGTVEFEETCDYCDIDEDGKILLCGFCEEMTEQEQDEFIAMMMKNDEIKKVEKL